MTIIPSGHAPSDVYRLMTGLIVPRPIAFVSTMNSKGMRNLAPFSFFTAISANPPVVCFSPLVRVNDRSLKDTLRNVEETREFVLNIVSESFAREMNACSADVPPDVDEFVLSGLTPVASSLVQPPRVREALASMECRLLQVVHVSDLPLGGSSVIGEVLQFTIDDRIVDNYAINPDLLQAIGRMGGATYARTTDRFTMERPTTIAAPMESKIGARRGTH